ncbi:acyltransferase family protein [Sphingomonas sp. Mn802worker]|uniref:acyltransferase family protein n=1 Tax=Sphingomonas sp. Mn802worker TaxID=629773 RepID=UPI00036947A4|nr:acyltransferase [Sphingomonas sp. Mn802worker]
MSELRALTGLRGIAAWLVVLYHLRGAIAGLPPAVERVLAKGYLAVDFFFLLSGFVIWLSWGERLRIGDAAVVVRFWQKRVARVWPLHLVMLAVAIALALLFAVTGRSDAALRWQDLPAHLVLVQSWGLADPMRWNYPAWSISCELAAYLAFPLLVAAVDWRRCRSTTLVGLAGLTLLLLHLVMRGVTSLGQDIPHFGIVRCLCEFATGTLVAALYLRRPPALPYLVAAAMLFAAWESGAPETLVVPAAFAALLLAAALTAGRAGNPLEIRVIHYLGEISYATYLSHYILWKLFQLAFVHQSGPIGPLAVAGYLTLVLAASALLYRFVERPAQRVLNRAGPRRMLAPAE